MRVGQQALREAMYAQHPYRLNPLGTAESVGKQTRANLQEFHRRFVVPNNLVLTVFGNVNAEQIREKVEKLFGSMKPVKLEFPGNEIEPLAKSVTRNVTLPREQAVVLLGYRGVDIFNPDRFALELLSEAYSGQGSRLFLRIRDELGLAYYVGAYELVGLDPGYFVLYVGTTPDKAATCEQEFHREMEKLRADGLDAAELERARASIIGQRKVRMQDNSELAMSIGLDELYGLGYDYFQKIDDKYRAVTSDDIKRVAKKYLSDQPHVTVVAGPGNSK
jgi:zinc protease